MSYVSEGDYLSNSIMESFHNAYIISRCRPSFKLPHTSFEMEYESVALYHALAVPHVDVLLASRDGVGEEREYFVDLTNRGDGGGIVQEQMGQLVERNPDSIPPYRDR